MNDTKLRVAVLRGGPSEEHEISLISGREVIVALKSFFDFEVSDVLIKQDGSFILEDKLISLAETINSHDVLFLALHGAYGEDGQLQAQIEQLGGIYTGSNAKSSAQAFSKEETKKILHAAPCLFAQSLLVTKENARDLKNIFHSEGGYMIKPNKSGSSFGVEFVALGKDLEPAVFSALDHYPEILVEERIYGTEVTCGVIERLFGVGAKALPVVEIIPPDKAGFFQADVKYTGETIEICPAQISDQLTKKVQAASLYAHETLGLSQYSRSDFLISGEDVYFLETNTLPGLTPESLLPKEITAAGSSYSDFVKHLVLDAKLLKGAEVT